MRLSAIKHRSGSPLDEPVVASAFGQTPRSNWLLTIPVPTLQLFPGTGHQLRLSREVSLVGQKNSSARTPTGTRPIVARMAHPDPFVPRVAGPAVCHRVHAG
jgi:hypothetical protein